MDLKWLAEHCRQVIAKHPYLRNAVIEIYEIAAAEVESGEPVENEVELAINEIDYLTFD